MTGLRHLDIESGHWDTHRKNAWCLKELLAPSFDQALPALISDLSQRGLLESTLVVVATEFGRTPRINDLAGRDHWPSDFSIVMAGAGVTPGTVVGAGPAHQSLDVTATVRVNYAEAAVREPVGTGGGTVECQGRRDHGRFGTRFRGRIEGVFCERE
ncbi:MAG: DUF1501 domain-containing protein [Planctomycetaceae bacterium]|nr:DUF1501 domain-containing protein [Planctomycetaceae bacterium]